MISVHRVRGEASCVCPPDMFGSRQSKSTGETLPKQDIAMQVAQDNNRISAGDYGALDMNNAENHLKIKREVVD
jgi:hypothetical protein